MLISLKWLSDYIDCPLSVEETADGLTMAGLEVEDAQSGYRVVSAGVLRRLSLSARGYIIEQDRDIAEKSGRASVMPSTLPAKS